MCQHAQGVAAEDLGLVFLGDPAIGHPAELRDRVAHRGVGAEEHLVGQALFDKEFDDAVEHAREGQVEVDVGAVAGEVGTLAGDVPRPGRVGQQLVHIGIARRDVGDFVEKRIADGGLVEFDEAADFVALFVPEIVQG